MRLDLDSGARGLMRLAHHRRPLGRSAGHARRIPHAAALSPEAAHHLPEMGVAPKFSVGTPSLFGLWPNPRLRVSASTKAEVILVSHERHRRAGSDAPAGAGFKREGVVGMNAAGIAIVGIEHIDQHPTWHYLRLRHSGPCEGGDRPNVKQGDVVALLFLYDPELGAQHPWVSRLWKAIPIDGWDGDDGVPASSPRRLSILEKDGERYFVDERLGELRHVERPWESRPISVECGSSRRKGCWARRSRS